jgi:hypothetical protein
MSDHRFDRGSTLRGASRVVDEHKLAVLHYLFLNRVRHPTINFDKIEAIVMCFSQNCFSPFRFILVGCE